MDTTSLSQNKAAFSERHAELLRVGEKVIDLMYGSEKRTWITLGVAFGMLVGGIAMMQLATSGAICAATG